MCLLNGAHLTNDAMGPTNGTGAQAAQRDERSPEAAGTQRERSGKQREATGSYGKRFTIDLQRFHTTRKGTRHDRGENGAHAHAHADDTNG